MRKSEIGLYSILRYRLRRQLLLQLRAKDFRRESAALAFEFQEFTFPRRTVSWIRLNKLVPVDPARWCSFVEVEAWGGDLR
jgi:hypothetical protein